MYWLDGGRYIVTILMCLFEGSLNVVIKHSQCGTKYVLQLDNIKLVLYRMTTPPPIPSDLSSCL